MTFRQMFLIGSMMLIAFILPSILMKAMNTAETGAQAGLHAGDEAETAIARLRVPSKPPRTHEEDDDNGGYSASANRDSSGHFNFDALMNGSDVPVMVDTGASMVAINLSTAEAIGLEIDTESRGVAVRTANGDTRAWPATIQEIMIGEVVVEDVRAMVLEDEALSETLLGMSFLNKLSNFNVTDGVLTMTQ